MYDHYAFDNNAPFYVGLNKGNMLFYPPDRIYADSLFGWAKLVNNQGVIEMLNSALVYRAAGIDLGTLTIIPEPSAATLLALGRAHRVLAAPRGAVQCLAYFGIKSLTNAFSSFNSFSVSAILLRLNSFSGTPCTISHDLPVLRIG